MTTSLLLALALVAAPEKRPFTIDALLAMPRVASPAVSPDGTQVAFTVANSKADGSGLEAAVWIVPTRGGEPRRLTVAKERAGTPRFSPDGRRLAFLSNRSGGSQVHLLDLAGGEAVQATSLATEVGDFIWAPDGKSLLVLSDVDPACGADMACNEKKDKEQEGRPHVATRLLYRHWNEWRERKRSHVLRVPLDGGLPVDLTPGDRDAPPAQRGGIADLTVSPDGKELLYVIVPDAMEAISTNGDIYAASLTGGGKPRPVAQLPGWDGVPRFAPGGKRLAWLSQARAGYESDRYRLMVAGPDAANPRELTAGTDLSVQEYFWIGPEKIQFTAEQEGAVGLWEVAVAGGAPRRLWQGGNIHALDAARDGAVVVGIVDSFTHPPEVVAIEGGKIRVLTHFTDAAVATLALGSARPAQAKGKDGATVPGWIVTPPGHKAGERHPAVVLVHGGPQHSWTDDWHYRWNTLLWGSQGWTVIIPNFRGSTGYGMAWQEAIRNNWGDGPFADIMAFTDMAVASGEADGSRMCAVGASYGGYMVNWINGHTDRFKCLIAHAGDFDVEAAYFDTEELWFPEWEMGGTWFQKREEYARQSPHRFADRWKTPTLVTHGELDFRVAFNQGVSTFTALQRQGIESKFILFPDEGHFVAKPRNAKLFYDQAFEWVRAHVGPAPGTAAQQGSAAQQDSR